MKNISFDILFYRSHGKTTLLRHIAKRAFNIPPTIDVLYCEQEVIADDTPAVEVVLNADVKCKELQTECKKLEELTEQGDTTVQNRLQEVIFINFFLNKFNKLIKYRKR